MSLSADDKVGMSLDDIIKARSSEKRAKPKAKGKKAAAGDKKKDVPKTAKQRDKSTTSTASAKVTKTAAAAKAKRAAKVDKARGRNATGKATNAEIERAVQSAVAKAMKTIVPAKKKPAVKAATGKGGAAATPVQGAGLKISFKPADLSKTTGRLVSAQINAVLAKGRAGGNGVRSVQKQVNLNTHAARVQASNNSLTAPDNAGGNRRRIRKAIRR